LAELWLWEDCFLERGEPRVGHAAAVAEAVRRWAAAGADAVVLQPTADDPDPEGFMRFGATDVGPLVD
jgi:alkanesulfonate monooxygenase SsuD/methylene tetrahydromethanopterin reductase-like flavin-dependent oxidoreductase (luciferase family)